MINKRIKVALVDDHDVVRTGFRLLLESSGEIDVIAELDSGEAIYREIGKITPDVIVIDLSMPGMGGLEALRRIRVKDRNVRILVFTMHDSVAFVEQAMDAGANGYITKNNAANVLTRAVKTVASGESYLDPKLAELMSSHKKFDKSTPLSVLSRREFQLFCKFAEGKTTQQIASELSLSVKTIANYQTQIKEKLSINTSTELIRLALTHGVIQM